ncbi:MAG: hypothetical protein KQ78_01185 [Candidatus Izimaplasma bacterium HR2]|nr:MAG: hypothetical protein KQ78_01185 [Candidatus Izimaplasma bacterium HR2]
MKKRTLVIVAFTVVLAFSVVLFSYSFMKTDKYMIAYVLESTEYNEELDIYNLSLFVPDEGKVYERQMSGIYYREYNITNDQVCISIDDDNVSFIWNFSYCEDE